MKNNHYDKALDIVAKIMENDGSAEDVIVALSEENLLFVDLPGSDEEGRFYVGNRPFWISWKNRPCVEARGLNGFAVTEGATVPIGEDGECLDVVRALLAAYHQELENS